jgi:hypothetical protein
MIARVLPAPRGACARFATLVRYVTRDGALEAETILAPVVASLPTAAAEMAFVAAQADTRTSDPCLHLVVSWRRTERPSLDEVKDTAIRLMQSLGLGEHQWLATRHADTQITHAHIVANRVDPVGHRTVNQIGNWKAIMRAARLLEHEHGWQPGGGRFEVKEREDGSAAVVDIGASSRLKRATLSAGAAASSARSGLPSFQEWVGDVVGRAAADVLATPGATWQRLHATLARFGVAYSIMAHGHRRGGVILDRGQSRWRAKASHLGTFASLPKLEAMLGAFEPAPAVRLPDAVLTYERHIRANPRATGARANYSRYRAAVCARNARIGSSLRARPGLTLPVADPLVSAAQLRRHRAAARHEVKSRIARASEPLLSFAEWQRANRAQELVRADEFSR